MRDLNTYHCQKFTALLLAAALLLPLSGCGKTDHWETPRPVYFQSYRDIPGVTEEEIDIVEALKDSRDAFIFGHITETEAFKRHDGSYAGFIYLFCELLTDLFDFPVTPVHMDSWEHLFSEFDRQAIDFIGDLTPTTARMETYHMTHAIAERSLRIFTPAGGRDIAKEADVNGLTVGFYTGSITSDLIKAAYPVNFETVDVESDGEAARMLQFGEIDAFVSEAVVDPSFQQYEDIVSKEFFPLVYSPVALSTANDELAAVISVVDKYILAGGIDILYTLYKQGDYEYTKDKLYNSFTSEEKAYIYGLERQGTAVSIAAEYDNYPLSFYNEKDGEVQGIAVDIINEISLMTGIPFRPVSLEGLSWTDITALLRSGEISMVTEMQYAESRVGEYIWSGVPYASSQYALLSKSTHPDITPQQVVRERVGALGGSLYESIYRGWFPNNDNLKIFGTQNEALDALERGEITQLMVTEIMLLTQTNYREKPGYKVNISFSKTADSFFGFNKNEVLLRSIVDKAQAVIDVDAIARSWTTRSFDYSTKLANMRIWYLMFFAFVLLVILVFIILLLLKTKRLGKDLEQQTATVSTIYTTIPDLVFCKDLQGVYTSCNPSFAEFAGMPGEDIIGKTDNELFAIDEEMARQFIEDDKRIMRAERTETIEEPVTYPDGSQRFLETIKTPLRQNKSVSGIMGISRDITRRRAAEEAAKVASKAKSAFLAHMSHEIRTPLNAIIGMSGIAKNSIGNPEKALSSINQILSASHHLLGILNDVLDMSKIESGKLELAEQPFGLQEAYSEVSGIITQRCAEKNIRFTTNIHEMADMVLLGDKLRVNQILVNLLGNAVKFTGEGGEIRLNVAVLQETGDQIRLRFTVVDSGIGMTPEQVSKLFVPFEQTDSTVSARFGGTGLGLSISQNLVNLMGGKIRVHSRAGQGSEFTFELQLGKGEGLVYSSEPPESLDLTGRRILLVEDIEINRIILREILAPTHAEICEALDGQQGLDIFAESPVNHFDLIFMDIQMPVMDGYSSTRAIRSLERADAGSVPIIAMTANAYKEDADKAMAAGMNGHLAKPIDMAALSHVLAGIAATR